MEWYNWIAGKLKWDQNVITIAFKDELYRRIIALPVHNIK